MKCEVIKEGVWSVLLVLVPARAVSSQPACPDGVSTGRSRHNCSSLGLLLPVLFFQVLSPVEDGPEEIHQILVLTQISKLVR